MRKCEDRPQFEEQMQKEIQSMFQNNVFKLYPKQQVPRYKSILPAIWSFRRKMTPDGTVYRHRARLCVHGGRQKDGIDFFETYAPVVSWTTVRFLFILASLKGIESRQIDYVQSFPQSDLTEEVFMQLPAGFKPPDDSQQYVLTLEKNLYGLKQDANNWFEHLKTGLLYRGFTQSKVDPCLFHRHDATCLIYVDDTIIFEKIKQKYNP